MTDTNIIETKIFRLNNTMDFNTEIENFMLCESIATNIIENYNITGVCLCIQCDKQLFDPKINEDKKIEPLYSDILQHVQSHMFNNFDDFPELYICDQCSTEYYSINDYEQHIGTHEYNDNINDNINSSYESDDDNYDSDNYDDNYDSDNYDSINYSDSDSDAYIYDDNNGYEYKYKCIICAKGYDDNNLLKEHFISRHIERPDLGRLEKKNRTGFPGFELLNKIKMSRYVRRDEKMNENMCVICCDYYEQNMDGYMDSDVMNIKMKNKKYDQFCDDMKFLYLNHIDYEPKKPMQLLCCGAHFCSKCLRNQLEAKRGRPECPFCKKDHTVTKTRFIIYDERPKEKKNINPNPYPYQHYTKKQ